MKCTQKVKVGEYTLVMYQVDNIKAGKTSTKVRLVASKK